jgi:hypothetical protein
VSAEDYAILVGVSHYPGLGDLSGPENDALAFKAWLSSDDGGQVPTAQIKTILSSDFPAAVTAAGAQPTTEAFKRAVDELHDLGQEREGRAGNRLYLFLAGHGFGPDLDETALMMANAAPWKTGHHIPGLGYANWFRRAGWFSEVVLFMDCCRENFWQARLQPCHLVDINGPEARYCYAFATKWSRATRERAVDGGLVQGLFTTALLAGLSCAGGDDGRVTPDRLKNFVQRWLEREAPEADDPDFRFAEGVVLCSHPPRLTTVRITVASAYGDQTVHLKGGDLAEVQPTGRDGQTWVWQLGRGLYKYSTGGRAGDLEILGDRKEVDVRL